MHHLRFRQVHLDFHTHGDIPGIGEKFSKRQFQDALKTGHIDSITLFSKCHHGYSYHPTKIGRLHPNLKFDLLARQIEACREIGVRCPIYISAGLDEVAATTHPEWLVKRRDGVTYAPIDHVGFKRLNFNSPYLDYLCAQIEEVVQRWPDNDGIFLDIIGAPHDYSEHSLREMKSLQLDPANPADVEEHAQLVLLRYYERTNAAVRSVRADTPVFHNGGHIPVGSKGFNLFNSHFELESLPTGGWGYDHFAFSARYAATQPRDYLGMTGKFHTTWGEFGGFKRPAALVYECGGMLAYGAKCSIGDQLHPNGEMNPDTYRLIGEAYARVEACEPWCDHVRPVARIAIVSAETNQPRARGHADTSHADEGAARMLLETHLPFVVLDENARWDDRALGLDLDLVILPDTTLLTPATEAKIKKYLARGGKVLAAGSALLDTGRTAFAIDPGATLVGRSPSDPDYLLATALTPRVPVTTPIVIHGGAWEIKPARGTRTLVERRTPYFNRTWDHFCSHQHAPDAPALASPAAIVNQDGNIAWFAHDIFTRYRHYGQPLYRDFVLAAIDHLLSDGAEGKDRRPVRTTLPTDGRVNVLEQTRERRYIAHLLYAPKSVRGGLSRPGTGGISRQVEVIEDLIPLRNVSVTLRLPRKVKTARLVPEGIDLPLTTQTSDGGTVTFTLPEFTAHAMVELRY
ncbi:alpha-amylase family protein [Geminisphaera colitermitum]|uniref:alpha-amylase family protein n=1 Tax=Geminisphaera colitermitum TaxID=1148786 RepID=UPI000158CE21|nr:alpha-amylase family protein [Geminisphaera colitermitum]